MILFAILLAAVFGAPVFVVFALIGSFAGATPYAIAIIAFVYLAWCAFDVVTSERRLANFHPVN